MPCPRQSAEWVIERPGGGNANGHGGVLANFGKASFSNTTARLSGHSQWLSVTGSHADLVNMIDSDGTKLATTGSLGKDHKSFSISYKNHGVTSTPVNH